MGGPFPNPSASSSNCAEVYFAHSGFKSDLKLGATPMVSISRDFLKDGAGSLLGINNKININGKIYDTGNVKPGLDGVLDKEYNLRTLFAASAGDFEIKYNNKTIFSGINAKVVSYNTEKTSDNWERSIDYTIELEAFENTDSSFEYRVSAVNETWSIEPEEAIYSSFGITANGSAPSDSEEGNFQATPYVTGIPQFRVTRKLSATGVSKDKYVSHINTQGDKNYNFEQQSSQDAANDAYLQAKKWVDSRIPLTFDQSKNQGGQYTPLAGTTASIGGLNLALCNHTRSINWSITEGTYEINDSWIGLGSGTPYAEEYSIECSTDDKFVKKVTVQGTIRGFQATNFDLLKDDQLGTPPNSGDKSIKISGFNKMGETGSFANHLGDTMKADKYHNALSGWINNVKKSLYSRASIAINSADRRQDYDAKQNSQNPVARKERVLNHIPISTSEGHDPIKGIITYSHEYNNSFKIFSGVISENVSITTNGPGDQIAEVFVIGRALGPVLQSLATKTSTTKSVTVELLVPPPTSIKGLLMDNSDCPFYTGGVLFNQCEELIEGLKPFGARQGIYAGATMGATTGHVYVKQDSYQWNPMDGRYTRNVEWVYQPCTKNNNNYQFLSQNGT
jgi:hypothetical protein